MKTLDDLKRELKTPYNLLLLERFDPENAIDWLIDHLHAKGLLTVWQPIETAPLGEHDQYDKHFIGMRVNGISYGDGCVFARCYKNKYGAYEWWGGGMEPTHWMPVPKLPGVK